MELRQLRYAVAVAEDLHFGRAADRLHVAQPSLSRQIRDLERSLDVRIFDRTSRTVVLTATGEAFIEMARRTIRMADAASDTARGASGWTGRVALGFVTSGRRRDPPAARFLSAAHPPSSTT
ncbi:LysR family transcriptional regulator [Brevibacterium casei]|nr:LysR family transcriptional regulator [Brevibacterium casei]